MQTAPGDFGVVCIGVRLVRIPYICRADPSVADSSMSQHN